MIRPEAAQRRLILDGIRPKTVPPSFLPDLTSVKSGRACLPFGRRVPRPPRQSRPDYRCQECGKPLACGLAPFGNRTAETLHRSVSGRSSARSICAVPPLAFAGVMPHDCSLPSSILCQCLDACHCLSVNRFYPVPSFANGRTAQPPAKHRPETPVRWQSGQCGAVVPGPAGYRCGAARNRQRAGAAAAIRAGR